MPLGSRGFRIYSLICGCFFYKPDTIGVLRRVFYIQVNNWSQQTKTTQSYLVHHLAKFAYCGIYFSADSINQAKIIICYFQSILKVRWYFWLFRHSRVAVKFESRPAGAVKSDFPSIWADFLLKIQGARAVRNIELIFCTFYDIIFTHRGRHLVVFFYCPHLRVFLYGE